MVRAKAAARNHGDIMPFEQKATERSVAVDHAAVGSVPADRSSAVCEDIEGAFRATAADAVDGIEPVDHDIAAPLELDAAFNQKILRCVAVIVGQEPYFHKDLPTGKWSGACIDMANDIAAKLSAKVETVESTWGNQILDLQGDKVDLAFAVNPTPERALNGDQRVEHGDTEPLPDQTAIRPERCEAPRIHR
jgi:ABC-type amino acid transport substrate-binding protein